jgi:hypothetical protein
MPHWTSSFKWEGNSYPYSVLGSAPSSGETTVIPVAIIPYRFIFSDGEVFDATTDLVDGVTPLAGVVNSPLFQNVPWSAGPTSLGTTQFGDAVLRANFWSSIPGNKSGYHVLLAQPVVLPVQVINVPADEGLTTVDSAGNPVGLVDFEWLTETTTNLNISLGIPPQALAIHLMSAIEGVDLNDVGSLGFHYVVFGGTASSPTFQPYIQTAYFSASSSIGAQQPAAIGTGALGHEIAETLNDPGLDNVVPAWQDPAFPHVCDSSLLEVGDPLEFVSPGFQVSLSGRDYTFPDVAFLPWFDRTQRSTSVNGWYSLLNTFTSPSEACPVFTNFALVQLDFGGVTSTNLTGVNNTGTANAGQAVGYITVAPNFLDSFVLNFSFTPAAFNISNVQQVYFPESQFTAAVKINDRGQIVGLYVDSGGVEHGFLLNNGQYSTIDFPGAVATEALAINNWIVPGIAGNYTDSSGNVHGFVGIAGKFIPVNASFAVNLSVNGMNDLGQLTGIYDLGGPLGTAQTFGFTGSLGLLEPLNYPQILNYPTSTLPNALNNKNEVVGEANQLRIDAFLEGGGNFQPISPGLDASLSTDGTGINDQGILVANFQDLAGSHAGFAIPVQLFAPTAGHLSVQMPVPFQVH